jgi:hypothetical protein
MRERRVIRLFLASPSDVAAERQAVVSVVNELNTTVARHLGVILELVRWEDMVPGIGEPQEVILEQGDLEAVDIFVGVLWNRFGTPTSKARSGTEEEFQLARRLFEMTGKPRVMLYFCQRPVNFTTPDQLDQKSSLLEFRTQLSKAALLRDFDEIENFQSVLRQDLTHHLFKLATPSEPPPNKPDHPVTPIGYIAFRYGSHKEGPL